MNGHLARLDTTIVEADRIVAAATQMLGTMWERKIAANNMQVAFAHDVTVHEAIARFMTNDLKVLDAPTLEHSMEEHEHLHMRHRQETGRRKSERGGRTRVATPTPRGRYHLQQFGGRGH